METNKVFGVIAFCSSFKQIKPSDLTGRYVTLKSFFSDKNLQDSSTHLCSVTQVMRWFFYHRKNLPTL